MFLHEWKSTVFKLDLFILFRVILLRNGKVEGVRNVLESSFDTLIVQRKVWRVLQRTMIKQKSDAFSMEDFITDIGGFSQFEAFYIKDFLKFMKVF